MSYQTLDAHKDFGGYVTTLASIVTSCHSGPQASGTLGSPLVQLFLLRLEVQTGSAHTIRLHVNVGRSIA